MIMKNIMNIILLFPLLIYVILLLINSNLLSKKEIVNFFWIYKTEASVITLISLFFVLYIIFIYFSWKFSLFFTNTKNKSLEDEKYQLKSKLADMIPEIETRMNEKFSKVLEDFKLISDKNLDLSKNQTKQVLGNLEFEIKNIKEILNKINK